MVHKQILKKNKTLIKKGHQLQKENDCIKNIFTPVQRKKLQSGGKQLRWEAEDISRAIAIYAAGPKAYRFHLKKGYPFPAVSTLKSWASKVDINPGYLDVNFKLMESCNLTPYQRVCVIMADEMKIQGSFEYDSKSDTLLPPASYVQVCMVRGLFENWLQPVFYSYNCKLTEDIVNNIISKLHEINYHVVAIVSDLGGGNRGLWNNLNINETTPYFINHCDETEKVYVFSDVPHMIKLLRNHFLDSGIRLENKLLTKQPLVELLENQSTTDLKIAHRLTPLHLSCKFGKRQKVKYATQLFSHTNSCALRRLGTLGIAKSENWTEVSNLLKDVSRGYCEYKVLQHTIFLQVNDWFDVFNARVPKINSRPRMAAYGLAMEEHSNILNKMEHITREMRIGSKKSLLPFQIGILNNISALKMLMTNLKEKYNNKNILTYRLNQDPLEAFFGVIRAKGGLYDHPTALQFKYRLRSFILGKNERIISEHANIKCDDTKQMQMDISTINTNSSCNDLTVSANDEPAIELNFLSGSLLDNLTKESIEEHENELLNDIDGLEHLSG